MTSAAIHQSEQPDQPALTTEARVSAGLGAVGLAAVFVGLGAMPNADWIEPTGALVHLATLPLVANLPAPTWDYPFLISLFGPSARMAPAMMLNR